MKEERAAIFIHYHQTLINITTMDIQIFPFSVWHEISTGISNIRK